jgi:proteasome accessory factor A
VLAQWESVLADLRRGYETLVGRIDWASKLWLLDTYRDAEQVAWDDPMLKSLDLEYHNLHPERGLCYGLEEEGRAPRLTTEKVVQLAQEHPPRNTRAFGRGELIRHLLAGGGAEPEQEPPHEYDDHASYDYIINWSNFKLRGAVPFFMADPFRTYVQDVRSHLAGRAVLPDPHDAGGAAAGSS